MLLDRSLLVFFIGTFILFKSKLLVMKKYEYKYVKTEATAKTGGTQKAINDDEALLTGFGLDGWRVNCLVGTYYLLEREIS